MIRELRKTYTERQTDRQTQTDRHKQTDRQTDTHTHTHTLYLMWSSALNYVSQFAGTPLANGEKNMQKTSAWQQYKIKGCKLKFQYVN